MKKLSLLFAAFFLILNSVRAQVPDNFIQNFKNNYPQINNARWEKEGDAYVVSFKDIDNVENNVVYGKDGKLIKTQMRLITTQIPAAITSYCGKKFSGEAEYKVWEEKDASDNKTYYAVGKTETFYFDKSGKFLRQEKRKDKKDKKEIASVSEKK